MKMQFSGHNTSPIQSDVINEIIKGQLKGLPHNTFMGEGLICKFNGCGIVYNPNNI